MDQDARIDLEAAAQASLAWANLIKTVGQQVDPFTEWHVELESSLPGSQKIRSIISLKTSAEKKAAIKGAIIASILFMFKEAFAWGVGEVLDYLRGPDAPEEAQSLSEEERRLLAEDIVRLLGSDAGRDEATAVYEALEKDEKVTGAGATSSPTGRPSVVVRRDQFPSRSADVEEPKAQRTSTDQVELILIRPVLTTDTSRRWGFQSRYGTFGAPIRDQKFLLALAEGRLEVPMSQGIRMIVELEITEEQDGGLWRPVDRVITRVIEVMPPPRQASLLDDPE